MNGLLEGSVNQADMYRIQLQQFEGPLDLLLFFIRRDELDIYDIPISQITDEYLAYVRLMQEIDLDGTADFIYMAAVLIGIKAKMLLPRPEVDDEGNEIDPRDELVQRLLEYMRYKEAANHLEDSYEARGERYVRGSAFEAETGPKVEPEYRVSVFDLISALKRVMDRTQLPELPHAIKRQSFSVEEQSTYILARLAGGVRLPFVALVSNRPRSFVIASFLAILDLAQRRLLTILPGTSPDDFRLAADDVLEEAHITEKISGTDVSGEETRQGKPASDRPAVKSNLNA